MVLPHGEQSLPMLRNELLNQSDIAIGEIPARHFPGGDMEDAFSAVSSRMDMRRVMFVLQVVHFDEEVMETSDDGHGGFSLIPY